MEAIKLEGDVGGSSYGGEEGRVRLGDGRVVTDKELLDNTIRKKNSGGVLSSFFLTVSDTDMPVVYDCGCGFRGIFSSVRCARCGRVL